MKTMTTRVALLIGGTIAMTQPQTEATSQTVTGGSSALKTTLIMAAAILIAGSGLTADMAQAQQPGTKRTDLQRHDLSAPGREVVQVRVDFDPEYVAQKHTHPGEEIIYVIEGTLEYYVEGRPAKTYRAGDVLIVPAGAIHWVKNVGTDNGAELATYIVEKGKPLITWVKQP